MPRGYTEKNINELRNEVLRLAQLGVRNIEISRRTGFSRDSVDRAKGWLMQKGLLKRWQPAARDLLSHAEQSSGGCLIWKKSKVPAGYGKVMFNGRLQPAHRVSWITKFGEIPSGMLVLHKCDNPSCINVEHLFLGSQQDNMSDKVSKSRQTKGETNAGAKLNDEAVREIRRLGKMMSHQKVADIFGVSQTCVSSICRFASWKHVKG